MRDRAARLWDSNTTQLSYMSFLRILFFHPIDRLTATHVQGSEADYRPLDLESEFATIRKARLTIVFFFLCTNHDISIPFISYLQRKK